MRTLTAAVIVLFLSLAFSNALVFRASAGSVPVGACPQTGQFTISTTVLWANLNCHHVGNVIVKGSGSLAMVNSTLLVDGNGTIGLLMVNGTAHLSLVSSSIAFTNGVGQLAVIQNGSLHMSRASSLADGSVVIANAGVLTANESSTLSPSSFVSHDQSAVTFNSTTLAIQTVAPVVSRTSTTSTTTSTTTTITTTSTTTVALPALGKLSIGGSRLIVSGSVISLAYTKNVTMSANRTYLLGSKIQSYGTLQLQVGNATLASSTTLVASTSFVAGNSISTTVIFNGMNRLDVVGSNLLTDVSSQAAFPVAKLSLIGGAVSVLNSSLMSTSRESFGFPPNAQSILNISATSNLLVSSSHLTSGQNQESGIARSSILALAAGQNTTVSQSSLQSLSFSPSLTVAATATNSLNYVTVSHSSLVSPNNPGSVSLSSGYTVLLDHAVVNAPASVFKTFAYKLNAFDSRIAGANVSASLVFGNTVTFGNFYNVTIVGCKSPIGPACLSVVHGGGYSVYGRLLVSVGLKQQNSPVAGADVTVFDSKTGSIDYSAVTDSSGAVRMPALIVQVTGTVTRSGAFTTLSRPTYVIQAFAHGQSSPQILVTSNSTFQGSLQLSNPVDMSTVQVSGMGARQLALNYNLVNTTYLIAPVNYYAVGPYLGAEFVPKLTIVSNAVQLNFRSIPSNSEIDFSTVGLSSPPDYFVLIYPRNMTVSPVQVLADGSPVQVTASSNSTSMFSVFSIPSGLHSIVLSYTPPNGTYSNIVYPYVYPSTTTIVLVVVLGVVALLLIVAFVRRRERVPASLPQAQSGGR